MAGVTDRPFRQLCKTLGANVAISEMVSANPQLWRSEKTRRRVDYKGETGLRIVQIAGSDPAALAETARINVDRGAQIIDVNMGCPAKKICQKMAGSALLQDETLVERILLAVCKAVTVPVTLKMRTGWDLAHRNAVNIAHIAEQSGVMALIIHGRTRACGYRGMAEYDTIRAVKKAVTIPVIANGDIDSPEKAVYVLNFTQADGLMIGRAAQGQPWIFREVTHYVATGERMSAPSLTEVRDIVLGHLTQIYAFYGEHLGVRMARKHLFWYSQGQPGGTTFRRAVNCIENTQEQLAFTRLFFERLTNDKEPLAA
jgi:tRNA-dihydrouridine synthase B